MEPQSAGRVPELRCYGGGMPIHEPSQGPTSGSISDTTGTRSSNAFMISSTKRIIMKQVRMCRRDFTPRLRNHQGGMATRNGTQRRATTGHRRNSIRRALPLISFMIFPANFGHRLGSIDEAFAMINCRMQAGPLRVGVAKLLESALR